MRKLTLRAEKFLKFQLSDHKSLLFLATFFSTMVLTTWNHFTKGEKQNSSMFHSYCNGCVKHHYEILKASSALKEEVADPIDHAVFNAEAALMEATANMEEDER